MNHSKTASPCLASKNKTTNSLMRLLVSVTRMIAHGHGNYKFAHYSLDLYAADSNHTIGSITKLLRDLEAPKATITGRLFENSGSTLLLKALLVGKEACMTSLGASGSLAVSTPLPQVLHVQLDNCWKDNKSRWSMILREKDFPTLPSLMQLFLNIDEASHQIIPHLIEEEPDFISFVQPLIAAGANRLIDHSKGQQFKFSMCGDEPIIQFKIQCTDDTWKPVEGIKLWKVDCNGKQLLPEGQPNAAKPTPMKGKNEIVKGLSGFIM